MVRNTFSTLFQESAAKYEDEVLLYDTSEDRSLNYADCLTLTEMTAKRLQGVGFTRGDIIANYCPLCLESVILCWACLYNGMIFLPVDHNWPAPLLKQVLDEASPCMIMTNVDGLSTVNSVFPNKQIILAGPSENQSAPSFYRWLEDSDATPETGPVQVTADDPAIILYTSGSTGTPKGVVLSQHALCMCGKLIPEHFGWEKGDSFMNLGDLHSMSGLRNTCLAPIFKGSSVIIAGEDERNVVLKVIELIQKLDIQYIGIAPTLIRQLNLLFSESRKEQLSPLKAILCTAGPLSVDLLHDFFENYKIPVYNYYGLTETAGICSGHNASTFSPDDNSIGIPVGAEFVLLPEAGYDDPDIGELLVKSDHLMLGYYRRDEETAAVLKNGWFHTGDIVQKREDGCYELLGRKKNFIKSIHAELIHLEEIDLALESFGPVQEACACSYAKEPEDEKIVAFVVAEQMDEMQEKEFIDMLKLHMTETLGKNRVPWCYYIKEKLPRNTLGKVERQKLSENLHALIQSEHTRYF